MQLDGDELVKQVQELLKEEVSPIAYTTWITKFNFVSMDDTNIVLCVETLPQKDFLTSRYLDLIVNAFNYLTNRQYNISIVLKSELDEQKEPEEVSFNNNLETEDKTNGYSNSTLNKKYTFDTFVIGENNRFAHAAACAVAESPGTAYNPLFIYGGVGLGKTHLMHAIGNEILRKNPSTNILYVTSEKFTNQLVNGIKDNSTENFRKIYRNIDVLLIDDIQFIQSKERVQEEFFHTFNTLHESNKQIIISSDRPPKELEIIEARLRSRFEWGLIADISKADYETRLAILKKKAEAERLIIDDDILANIATRVSSNIRELEGVLNKVIAFSSLSHGPIGMEMAEKAINDIISQKERVISSEYIQETVAKYFDITREDIKGSKRSNDIAFPRQIAMYLCREIAQMPFTKIGFDFGKRDHTTVMHAYNKIENEIKEKKDTKLIVDSVKKIILGQKDT